MDTSQRGIDLIIEFEGKHTELPDGRYRSYRCPANVSTIYCGLTKGVRDGMVIDEATGQKMFAKELATYEDAVERLVKVPLNQHQFDALVSFTYNVGPGDPTKPKSGGLANSTLLKVLNQGKYAAVPGQLMRWNKGGGRVLSGLTRRRKAEGALFMQPVVGEATAEEARMPQAVQESKGTLKEAAKSPTILSSVAGLFSSIGVGWQFVGTVASDTTAEVTATKQSLSGFEALWSHLGVSLGGVLLLVTIGALGVVLVRHVQRYLEGRA
jgi:lysozyme